MSKFGLQIKFVLNKFVLIKSRVYLGMLLLHISAACMHILYLSNHCLLIFKQFNNMERCLKRSAPGDKSPKVTPSKGTPLRHSEPRSSKPASRIVVNKFCTSHATLSWIILGNYREATSGLEETH